jgi:3-oxoacyl-[acyl-carrier protein] reductase
MNAIITGATKGMGRAIALSLAEAGYNIAICARSQSDLDNFCNEIKQKFNVQAIGLETDCSDSDQLNRFTDFIQQHFQTVEVLVNNAGIYIPAAILDEPEGLLQKQMQVNLFAAHTLSRVFGKKMRESRLGHIFNISSIAAIKPVISAGSYSVTKMALLGLTKVLREELMPYDVKVTAILPGSTLTASWEGTDLPADRFVSSSDVADAVIACLKMSKGANVDEIIIRPVLGEI